MGRIKKDETVNEAKLEKNETVNEVKLEKVEKTKISKTKVRKQKKKLVLTDTVPILVSNNLPNDLIYINHKSGDLYMWQGGETQQLYVSDIRAMKSNQRKFLEENWISIEGISDDDDMYADVEINDILEALQISHYYKDKLYPKNLSEIFNWKNDEIRLKVPKMPKSVKESIVIMANDFIKKGILDSISKVKGLEEALDCQLTSPDDE